MRGLILAISLVFGLAGGRAATAEVDLALVMLIDASVSVSDEVYLLQVEGHAAALASDAFVGAVELGANRAVAVTVVQFSGPNQITQAVPWTVVRSAEDAQALSEKVATMPPLKEPGSTAIAHAIRFASKLFVQGGYEDARRVIDVSANGFDNISVNPTRVRDPVVAEGITINGIVLLDEYEWLPEYFSQNIIGGDGAFVMSVSASADYERTLLAKLVSEIVGIRPPTQVAMRQGAAPARP